MIKNISLFLVLFSLVFSLSCSDSKQTSNSKTASNRATSNKPAANTDVKTGVAPVADNEVVVLETDYGPIKIELYSNIAPKMVARFKELAKEGYYNGIAFHRVNQSVIQAGNSDTKEGAPPPAPGKEGDSGKPNVPAEFSDVPYDTGIVGAARTQDVNSANSQFFITLSRSDITKSFDGKYTIFGKVIEGMNNVVTISGVPKEGEKPIEAVRIKSATVQPK